MALKDDKIKDLFSSKLNNLEPEVPASLWNDIDRLLSEQSISAPPMVVKKNTTMRTVLIGLAVAASIAIGIFFALDKTTMPTPQNVVQDEVKIDRKKEEIKDSKEHEEQAGEEVSSETPTLSSQENISSPTRDYARVFAQNNAPEASTGQITGQMEQSLPQSPVADKIEEQAKPEHYEQKIEQQNSHKQEKEAQKPKTTNQQIERKSTLSSQSQVGLLSKSHREKDNMSFAVRTNAGVLSGSQAQRGNPLLFSQGQRSASFVALLASENKDYEMTHSQPISVGVTISRKISDRVSLETGLMFTHLSSKVTSNSEFEIKEELKFGYLGIPLSVNYNFYELGKAKFFLSAGLMAQKDIYGKYTSEANSQEMHMVASNSMFSKYSGYREPDPSYLTKSVSQPNWQFSSHMTVGASYPIYGKLNIYTSVGGAYYFDANNHYKTIYSDREFQLDLNLGFKFDF